MLPPQLVGYGLQHISLDSNWFILDSVARHLDTLLQPVSLTNDQLIPTLNPPPPEVDPLQPLLAGYRAAIGLTGSGDEGQQLAVGNWPALDEQTIGVFRGVRMVLGKAEGRSESTVAMQEPPPSTTSSPESPVLSRRAMRETPRVGQESFESSLIPRTRKDLATVLVTQPQASSAVADEVDEQQIDIHDALHLKPAISKGELTQMGAVLARLGQGQAFRSGINNPILEAAKARRQLIDLALDSEWGVPASAAEAEHHEPDICSSPPIFPRLFDTTYYHGRNAGVPAANTESSRVIPASLGVVGKLIQQVAGRSEAEGENGDSSPVLDVLDVIQFPTLPSDITFSSPSTTDAAGPLWLDESSPPNGRGSNAKEAEDEFGIVLPRRTMPIAKADLDHTLSPSSLRSKLALVEPIAPVIGTHATLALPVDPTAATPVLSPSLLGTASSPSAVLRTHDRDEVAESFMQEVFDMLTGPRGELLDGARALVGEELLAKDEGDFPIPTLPSLSTTTSSRAIPTTLREISKHMTGFEDGGPGGGSLLTLGLDLGWRPLSHLPSSTEVLAEHLELTTEIDTHNLQTLEDALEQVGLASLSEEPEVPVVKAEPDDLDFVRTRRELDLQHGDGIKMQETKESLGPPKKRLRELSEESGNSPDPIALDKASLRIFDLTSPSPSRSFTPSFGALDDGAGYAAAALASLSPPTVIEADSLGEDVNEEDEPVALALGEEEMVLDVPGLLELDPVEGPSPSAEVKHNSQQHGLLELNVPNGSGVPSKVLPHTPSKSLAIFLATRALKHGLLSDNVRSSSAVVQESSNEPTDSSKSSFDAVEPDTSSVAMPENLPILEEAKEAADVNAHEAPLHCVFGDKLLNSRSVWKRFVASKVRLHYRASPMLSIYSPSLSFITGLDALLTPHVGLIIHPLAILPSVVGALRTFLPSLRSRVDTVYIVCTVPSDRDVWTEPVRKAVGQLRRSTSLLAGEEYRLVVKVGWAQENDIGQVARRLAIAHQTSPETGVSCLGGDWLGALEAEGDEQCTEDELELSAIPGLNAFCAAWVLFSMQLDDFLRLDPEERLALYGPFFGLQRMALVNAVIRARFHMPVATNGQMSPLPPSSPPPAVNPHGNEYNKL